VCLKLLGRMDHTKLIETIESLHSRLSSLENRFNLDGRLDGLALAEQSKKPEVKLAKLIVKKVIVWLDDASDEKDRDFDHRDERTRRRDDRFIQISGLIEHFIEIQRETDSEFTLDFERLKIYIGIEFRDKSPELFRYRTMFTNKYRQIVLEIINRVQDGSVRMKSTRPYKEDRVNVAKSSSSRPTSTDRVKELSEEIVDMFVSWSRSFHDPVRKDFETIQDKINSYHWKDSIDGRELANAVYEGLQSQPDYFVNQRLWNRLQSTIDYCFLEK
jgi:hypothetical protein